MTSVEIKKDSNGDFYIDLLALAPFLDISIVDHYMIVTSEDDSVMLVKFYDKHGKVIELNKGV